MTSAQYASAQITEFAAAHGITRSMGYTGICWDNAMAESFFVTLKTEFYPTRRLTRVHSPGSRSVAHAVDSSAKPGILEYAWNRGRHFGSLGLRTRKTWPSVLAAVASGL
ncbi:transposase [Cryobacterium sp. TMT1-21]|uniref:Transposase n=1 Tax=Cryobacterium shii TaxID=1259235 RepID=A0AAQ2HG43_9MICO|nr:transposase [Cryobacterium shii]TFD17205.1 transposase [Cryobacterium sp. TMT1-21]TFD40630.1 transposase [Cryobacterium sp. TMT2-10]